MSLSLQKQHHINQLLTTAAGGTGVVGDLDALHAPHHMAPAIKGEPKAERNLWREDEMLQMLHLMLKANAIELLNDKTVKSEKVFRNIEKLMFESGYTKKTFNQIWTKWKFLKSTYMTSKRAGIIPKMIPPSIYTVLETILTSASNVSICSNSNGAGGSSIDGDMSDSGRMGTANVELSGLSNGVGKSGKKQSNGGSIQVEDDAFGMAHPIFGFRLGMVKAEPEDAGYETPNVHVASSEHDPIDEPNDNSHCSSPANVDLPTHVKTEIVDAERSNSPPTAEEQPQLEMSPKLPESAATSTPKANIPPQMPPLRIAPFAKASQMNMQRPQMNRSPPPLSMHPMQQQKRQQQAMQQVHHHFTRRSQGYTAPNMHRQMLPKPDLRQQQHHQQHRVVSTSASGTQIRLPREITLHQTRPMSIARTKHVPMRPINNTTYKGQKIETVVPDIGSDIMLQQKQHVYPTYVPAEHPSTSHQAATGALAAFLSSPDKKQKRRLQLPNMNPRPAKLMRTQSNIQPTSNYEANDFYRDNFDAGDEADQSSMREESIKQTQQKPFTQQQKFNMQQQKKFQQQQKQFQQQQKQFQQQQKKAQKKQDEDNFDAALKELGKSMRLVQREILDDFFEKQMDMAREEHEFQAQQDKLLMQAFEEQTQIIMKSAKTLLGIELPGLKKTTDAKMEGEAAPAEAELQKKEEVQKMDEHVESEEEHAEEEEEEEDEEACMEQEDEDDDDEDDEAEGEDEDESESEEAEEHDEENMEQHAGYFNQEHENENFDEEQEDEDSYEDEDQLENHATDPSELVSSELVED